MDRVETLENSRPQVIMGIPVSHSVQLNPLTRKRSSGPGVQQTDQGCSHISSNDMSEIGRRGLKLASILDGRAAHCTAIYGGGRVGLADLLRAQEKKREGMADSCFGGVVPARKALSSPLSSPSRLKSYSHPHLRRRRVLFLSMAASDPSHPSLLVFSGLLSHLIFFFHSRIGFFFFFFAFLHRT